MSGKTVEQEKKAETLLRRLDKLYKFESKHGIYPPGEARELVDNMSSFAGGLPEIAVPKNRDELIFSELKRRLGGEAAYLDQMLCGGVYGFDSVLNVLGIPRQDIDSLRPWLEENREETFNAIDRLFKSREFNEYELSWNADIPHERSQAEEVALSYVKKYHRLVGKFLQEKSEVGDFLRDIEATVTTNERSYFNQVRNLLAISIPGICFSNEDGVLHIRDNDLIRIYGHEGMGHALNFILSKSKDLPYFLTKDSALTTATAESVAQFYEKVLLEDLRNSRDLQRRLNIEHKFEDIYQYAKDTKQLKEYQAKLFYYAIALMADRSFGKLDNEGVLEKKTKVLDEVALDKSAVRSLVENCKKNVNYKGELNTGVVAELRYCARPVERALDEFVKQGMDYNGKHRGSIDKALLTGLWTPIGFVDNARISAGEYAQG